MLRGADVDRFQQLQISKIMKPLGSLKAAYRELYLMVSMGKQLHPSFRSPRAIQRARCSGVKLTNNGLQSSGDMLFAVTNHPSLSGNPTEG